MVKFVFIDAGDTLIHLRKPPGVIYMEEVSRFTDVGLPESDVSGAFYSAWRRMPEMKGLRDRFSAHKEGEKGWWRELFGVYLNFLKIDIGMDADRAFEAVYNRFNMPDIWLVDKGVHDLSEFCVECGAGLGIISNWDSRLSSVLSILKIRDLFDPVIVSAEFGYEKPSEKIFHYAMDVAGCNPDELVYAGDKYELDYVVPRKMGWRPFLVGNNPKNVKNLSELAQKLKTFDL